MSAPSVATAPYRPCFFTCTDWQEKVVTDKKGKPHFRMIDKTTNEVYFSAKNKTCCTDSKTDLTMRGNFAAMVPGSVLFMPLVRMPLRIYSLFCGDFVTRARTQAKNEYDAEWMAWATTDQKNPAPTKESLASKERLYIAQNLAIEICQIILYPLAAIALLFIALYSAVIDPVDGGKAWGAMERLMGQKPVTTKGDWFDLYQLTHILMPCRQPLSIWKDYRLFEGGAFSMYALRGLLYQIDKELDDYKPFFHEIDTKKLNGTLEIYRNTLLLEVSPNNADEFERDPISKQLKFSSDPTRIRHAEHLEKILQHLQDVRNNWTGYIQSLQSDTPTKISSVSARTLSGHCNSVDTINAFSINTFSQPLPKPQPLPAAASPLCGLISGTADSHKTEQSELDKINKNKKQA